MKKKMLACGAFAIIFSGAFFNDGVHANPKLDEIKDQRQEVKSELTKAEKEIADVLLEIKEINDELEMIKTSLQENQNQLDATEEEIENFENEIANLQEEIELLEIEIEKRNEILKSRISSYQENGGNIQYLEVFFGAKDFTEFISRLSAVTAITSADSELIEQQRDDQRKIEEKQEKIEEKLQEQEELLEELKAQEELIMEQKESVEAGKKELESKEKELTEKKSKLKSKDNNLAALENEIRAQMAAPAPIPTPQSNSGANTTSNTQAVSGEKFAWPTQGGYISSHMGQRWGRMHNGIDIARTDRSTSPPIFAVEGGTVESAGYSGSFGNKVVINHGNGVKTLYAHLASMSVSPGQSVSRGETIGVMGTTGRSTGIHLHFEVHVNGSIQNPINYLR